MIPKQKLASKPPYLQILILQGPTVGCSGIKNKSRLSALLLSLFLHGLDNMSDLLLRGCKKYYVHLTDMNLNIILA